MTVFIVLAGVILVAVTVALLGVSGALGVEPPDAPDAGLPHGRPLRSEDLPGLRFRVGLRGYRMEDVDAALDRLGDALALAESAVATPASPPQADLSHAPPLSSTEVADPDPDSDAAPLADEGAVPPARTRAARRDPPRP